MHGGKSTGPRTAAGMAKSRKANFKHGFYSAETLAERQYMRQFLRMSSKTIEQVENKSPINALIQTHS